MEKFNCKKYWQKGISRIGLVLLAFLFILLFFAYQLFFIPAPILNGTEDFRLLPAEKTITLKTEHVRTINISITQGGKEINLLKDAPDGKNMVYTLEIKPKTLSMIDGPANVVVRAEAGMFKKTKQDINAIIDTIPPSLEVIRIPEIVYQGGAGFVLLRVKKAESVFLQLDDSIFPAYRFGTKESSGSFQDDVTADYGVFFPVPYNVKAGSVIYAIAKDLAGNKNVQSLRIPVKTASSRWSSISIDDGFINNVVMPLLNETGQSDHVAAFKKVNEDLRAKALEKLASIGKETEPRILWKGPFLQLKNSKVMARYGDQRTYTYKGKAISSSVHLGYDLASIAHSTVEAANSGIVRFAGDLSIYGNAVIIDHGMGLMSLYGHLSLITVSEGQKVNKGDMIGKTGSTGLAGGDHLHFGILIHGYEVSPLFWWDPHWVKVNVLDYLKG